MYRTILLAYDGSTDGREALCQGAKLAKLCQAEVQLVAVVTTTQGVAMAEAVYPSAECIERDLAEARRVLEEGEAHLKEHGLTVTSYLRHGEPVAQIASIARQVAADLIVVGHREQGALARWWRGSVGASLLANAPCSVLVCVLPSQHEPAIQDGLSRP